jgi:hypothetical protein
VAAGIVIDPVSLYSINPIARERLKWCKGDSVGGCGVQNPDVQAALNPIKLPVQAAEKELSFKFPHQITKNYYAWSVSKNRDLMMTGRKMRK